MEYLGPPAATHDLHDRWNSKYCCYCRARPFVLTPLRLSELFREDLSTIQGRTWLPGWFDVELKVRCDDSKSACEPLKAAYTTNDGNQGGQATINFCPDYFRDEIIADLDKRLRDGQNGDYSHRNNMSNYYRNRGERTTSHAEDRADY